MTVFKIVLIRIRLDHDKLGRVAVENKNLPDLRRQATKVPNSVATYPEKCVGSGNVRWRQAVPKGVPKDLPCCFPQFCFSLRLVPGLKQPPPAPSIGLQPSPGGKRFFSPTKIPEVT